MSFGKRPAEELYDMVSDPDCVNNLANDPQLHQVKHELERQLMSELTNQGDPRVLGKGAIFDFYPNCRVDRQQKLYERPEYDPIGIFNEKFGTP